MEEMAFSEEGIRCAAHGERLCSGAGLGTTPAGTPDVTVFGRKSLIMLIFSTNGNVAARQQVIGIVTKRGVP